ncbi:helix-turn-helix transcriptional regulator [Nonomuraea sp. NPDC048826]|uniref:helix-turn-helix domain-containing protein n=1 Tax=Nonomuraea sp. NPDC048826 TaxID=3364347 RepID=UPI0037101D81
MDWWGDHRQLADALLAVIACAFLLVDAFVNPSARPAPHKLTSREADVLQLVGRTMSNQQIADHLHISEATVKTHLNRLMAKLDVSSRAQAVALAYCPSTSRGTAGCPI